MNDCNGGRVLLKGELCVFLCQQHTYTPKNNIPSLVYQLTSKAGFRHVNRHAPPYHWTCSACRASADPPPPHQRHTQAGGARSSGTHLQPGRGQRRQASSVCERRQATLDRRDVPLLGPSRLSLCRQVPHSLPSCGRGLPRVSARSRRPTCRGWHPERGRQRLHRAHLKRLHRDREDSQVLQLPCAPWHHRPVQGL